MWHKRLSLSSVLWILCLVFTAAFWIVPNIKTNEDTVGVMRPSAVHHVITSQTGWLNTERPLVPDDLRGRIILLDFWTYCCINCMHVIPDLKYLERKFGGDLTVIGVHSAKFKNEADTENIRQAILRYGIEHPVVNDFDFALWKRFGIRSWPTFVLINPKGLLEVTLSGEGHREELEKAIENVRKKYAGLWTSAPLPIALEKDKAPVSFLSFPGKIESGEWGNGDKTLPVLYVSDSAHHRILAVDGERIAGTIGSGKEGFKDGDFDTAQFRRPQGLLFSFPYLYIADTENHAIRRADVTTQKVVTIAGTGQQGRKREAKDEPALKTPIASPWDLAFYPDEHHIAIAMAGTHQLWSYDIDKSTLNVLAGNGHESIDDGEYPNNSLSQPSGLSAYDGKLYFVDAETSALRVFEDGKIKTLIGTGLFDFGYKDGKQGEARMQHPLGLFADESGVYIADSYNHSIRRFDPKTSKLANFAGHGKRGTTDGALKDAAFNEPGDLLKRDGKFYIADTNNHAIRIIDDKNVSTLSLTPPMDDIAFAYDMPNVQPAEALAVASNVALTVDIELKAHWKINKEAPSYLALFDMTAESKPKLVATYDLETIRSKAFTLPGLKPGPYRLQSTLYYCEDAEGSQCLLKSFDTPLKAADKGEKRVLLKLN